MVDHAIDVTWWLGRLTRVRFRGLQKGGTRFFASTALATSGLQRVHLPGIKALEHRPALSLAALCKESNQFGFRIRLLGNARNPLFHHLFEGTVRYRSRSVWRGEADS